MTFDYNAYSDKMLVSISEPESQCVYVEGQTPGVILRVEDATGTVRSFEVLLWSRRIAENTVLIPEIANPEFQKKWPEFQKQWLKNLELIVENSRKIYNGPVV
jgi:hypothetical protein